MSLYSLHIAAHTRAEQARFAAFSGIKTTVVGGERRLDSNSHIFFRMNRSVMQRYLEWDSPWMDKKVEACGGALLNLGGHGFDIARFVTGEEPEVVSAAVSYRVSRHKVEDYAFATLRMPSGILFHNELG